MDDLRKIELKDMDGKVCCIIEQIDDPDEDEKSETVSVWILRGEGEGSSAVMFQTSAESLAALFFEEMGPL